jgi:clan AA aspartic protease (TIGR02281 family)
LKSRQILGAVALAVGAIGLGFGLLLVEPDPTDVSTATGAAFYNRGNYGDALRIFRTLADQSNARAQFNLGIMYANGHGVVQDDEEALKWYRLAAEQNDVDAQNNLGVMYLRGRGVPRDNVRAHMWFSLASAAPNARDAEAGRINRDMIATEMSADQLTLAQRLARECQRRDFRQCDGGTITASAAPSRRGSPPARRITVPLEPDDRGTYVVPVLVNAVERLKFTVDSGAAYISIPRDLYLRLRAGGTIADRDLLGFGRFVLADGSGREALVFSLRSVEVGGIRVQNVIASVAPTGAEPLLGQSFLSELSSWSMDNRNHTLVIN